MISPEPEEICMNRNCKESLDNGRNIGGWLAIRKNEGGYKTGYECKRCGNQSAPSKQRLALYQKNYSYHNITNQEIEHKRAWQGLLKKIDDDGEGNDSEDKMPEWNDVLDRMEKKNKKEAAP